MSNFFTLPETTSQYGVLIHRHYDTKAVWATHIGACGLNTTNALCGEALIMEDEWDKLVEGAPYDSVFNVTLALRKIMREHEDT